MRDVRQHILALPDYPMGSVAKPHSLHSLRANRRPMARQALRQPDQARALTISRASLAPDRVGPAGFPITKKERQGVTEKALRGCAGKLSQPNKPMKRTKKELKERKAKAAEIAAMYVAVAGGGDIEFRHSGEWKSSIGPDLESDLSFYRVIPAPPHPPIKKKTIPAQKKKP